MLMGCTDVSFVVSFDSNGGNIIEPMEMKYWKIQLFPNPTKDGYEFVGWYLDESLTIPISFTDIPQKEVTLYAKWSLDEIYIYYTLTYDCVGGSPIEPVNIMEGNKMRRFFSTIKEGYIFDGWYLDSNYTQKFSWSYEFYQDVTIYAKWLPE